MMGHEDITTELTAEPVIKIIGEPMQNDIDLLKEELAECMAKIKTTKDICTLILQAVEEPFLKALKEENNGYDGIQPTMIAYLQSKISKVTNQDKVAVKEIFIPWEIEVAKKKLERWNITVSDDDIVILIVEQMHESDWFSEEHMTEWEECDGQNKTWEECKIYFERCHIARKWYLDAKGARKEKIHKIAN